MGTVRISALVLATILFAAVELAAATEDAHLANLPADVEMQRPIQAETSAEEGEGEPQDADQELLGRLFVLIAPGDLGPAALVAFDVTVEEPPHQRETYETSITGDAGYGGQEPALDALGRFLFVPGGQGDNIAVYTLAGDGTIAEIPESPFPAEFGSFELAVHPSGNYLYSSEGLRGVHVFKIGDDGVLELIDKGLADSPRDIELTPDGRRLYVAEGFSGLRGFAIQADGTLIPVPGSPFRFEPSSRPFEVEISSDGRLLFVQDLDLGVFAFEIEDSGSLSLIPGSPFPTGEFSHTTRLTSDDAFLYVSSSSAPRLHAFGVKPDGALALLGGSPFPGGNSTTELIEVPERKTLFEVNPYSGIVLHEILDDGQLLLNLPFVSLVDALGRTSIGAVFVPSAGSSPPLADAGEDSTAECAGPDGASVVLDGSGSTDPDSSPGTNDDILLFEWFDGFGSADERFLGEGESMEATLSVGPHTITLRVTDRAGVTATDEVVKTVADTTPPVLDLSLDPDTIWPPNHRMVDVRATVEATDICGPASFTLLSVESDEPADGAGDGSFQPDIDGVEAGTPDVTFKLRAERSGSGQGRTYRILYAATDESGNQTTVTAECVVAHDQGSR